jgi:hypothetical protein
MATLRFGSSGYVGALGTISGPRNGGEAVPRKGIRGFLQWSQHRWNEGVGGEVLQAHDQRERAGVLGGVAAW